LGATFGGFCLDLAVIRAGIVGTDGVKPYNTITGNDPAILSATTFLVGYTKMAELNHISWQSLQL